MFLYIFFPDKPRGNSFQYIDKNNYSGMDSFSNLYFQNLESITRLPLKNLKFLMALHLFQVTKTDLFKLFDFFNIFKHFKIQIYVPFSIDPKIYQFNLKFLEPDLRYWMVLR